METKIKLYLYCLASFLICLPLPYATYADELGELRGSIETLREENRALREKLQTQEALIQGLANRLDGLETTNGSELSIAEQELASQVTLPKANIKGFADISFKTEVTDDHGTANPNTFALGDFDFIITSHLAENIDFFNESIIEFEDNTTEIDIERLYLKYSLSNLFNIIAGRIHTPLGYWNTAFHHGKWFQTTATRPLVMEFEHVSGLLPLHMVGVDFLGNKTAGQFDIEYHLGIGNGRHNARDKVQNIQDTNDAKAINTSIMIKPQHIPGLTIGFSSYFDKIPSRAGTAGRDGEIREAIMGGSLIYARKNLEMIFEGFEVRHKDETSQKNYDTAGLYLQAGYKIQNKWTPYYRFDLLDFAQGDPYYSGLDTDEKKHSLGIRWDLATWNALKFEYGYSERKGAADKHMIVINDSFPF